MSAFMRYAGLIAVVGLIGLAGCGTKTAGSPGAAQPPPPVTTAPSTTSPAPPATSPAPSTTAPKSTITSPAAPLWSPPGSYLTDIRTGQYSGYDRVAFQFSGKLPAYTVERVKAVYRDPKGDQVPMAGQSYLRVVFRGTSTFSLHPPKDAYTGPGVLTPYYPELLTVAAAGDFEGVLSFGAGLAAQGSYHVFTLSNPSRLVVDVSHVALGNFPGIWNITSWPSYWATQYSWLNGHQPWLSSPALVVEAWARSHDGGAPIIRQVNANTFKVTEPSGKTVTVTGIRPVSVPGPWVITHTG